MGSQYPTPVPARNISSPLKSSWRWGSSGRGHSNYSSPPSALNQSESSCIMPSIPQVGWGIWWALSILASLSGLSLTGMGALPSANVTQHFYLVGLRDWVCNWMVPLWQEVAYGSPVLSSGSPWWEVTRGSPQHPADLDLLCQWLPECQQLNECWRLPKCWWLMEQINHSILSSSVATATRAQQLGSLTMANIPSHESSFKAVNPSYVWQLAATNSDWASGQGTLASICLHHSSGCADSCLSWRCSLSELSISWQSCSYSSLLPQTSSG